jgi:F-type H+-transporting ATPase subunit gamma
MPSTLELKRRIRSIKSTKKITRAMQMISAAKMRKAQQAAFASRSYSDLAWQIINNLADKVDPKYHALLSQRNAAKKVGVILVTTNRGYVGGFNSNLNNSVRKYIFEQKEMEVVADLVVMGKKGREAMVRMGANVVADFPKHERTISVNEISPLSKLIVGEYLKGTYSQILIVYTHFISTITQKAVMKQLLPFKSHDPGNKKSLPVESKSQKYEYVFEPSPDQVLEYLIPRILESQIYQAVLESDASEHSARMIMMKNATDAANDLVDDLTLVYNKLRQANITKELSEITAGKIALE